MIDIFGRDFCLYLEFWITKFLENSNVEETKGFWCDGLIFETMIDANTARFDVYFGKDGQGKYKLFLKLGETSSKLFEKGGDIESYVPDFDQVDDLCVDIRIDIDKRQVYLSLD